MRRPYILIGALLAISLVNGGSVFGQETEAAASPPVEIDFAAGMTGLTTSFTILALAMTGVSLGFWIASYLAWVRSCDWVNRDRLAQRLGMGWNFAMFFPFALAFPAVVLGMLFAIQSGEPLPLNVVAILSWGILFAMWAIPLGIYVRTRNQLVEMDKRVFTSTHRREWLAPKLEKIGIKIRTEPTSVDDIGPAMKFKPTGGATDRDNTANLLMARQSEGYLPAREIMAETIDSTADACMLDFGAESVAVRFQIDGVWHQGPPRERAVADPALAVFKLIAARNPNERRARQQGDFGLEYNNKKYTVNIAAQGTQTGERALLKIIGEKPPRFRFAEMGMRDKMAEELREQLAKPGGIVVVSAPPNSGGLTSLYLATLSEMDRYTRGFLSIVDESYLEMDVENVPINVFKSSAGETPATLLPRLIREYPDVFVVPDMKDAASAAILCDQAIKEKRTVVTSVRAKEASESLLRLLMLKIPPAKLAPALHIAVNQRLIRKLCDACKEAFQPTPQMLQQLGIPQGKVQHLYRLPTPNPEEPKPPCEKCRGIGYYGRTGLFEVLIVNDLVRQTLQTKPQLEALRAAARKAGMRTIQEEGVLLVARGVTSVQELMRVLKDEQSA